MNLYVYAGLGVLWVLSLILVLYVAFVRRGVRVCPLCGTLMVPIVRLGGIIVCTACRHVIGVEKENMYDIKRS